MLKNIEVRAGFKSDEAHREYGRRVRDQLIVDVLAAASTNGDNYRAQLHAAEDAFEQAANSIDSGALLEVWCEIEGTVDGRYMIREYVRQL